ncbi:MAG: hypothetical protein QXS91_02380 [Candidatus Anstonellales archaeon]
MNYLKLYKEMIANNAFDDLDNIMLIEKSIKSKDYEMAYFISRAIYARAKHEKTKIKLSLSLINNGLENIVPFKYLKIIEQNPYLIIEQEYK